jgi:hypothetical protein
MLHSYQGGYIQGFYQTCGPAVLLVLTFQHLSLFQGLCSSTGNSLSAVRNFILPGAKLYFRKQMMASPKMFAAISKG